MNNDNYILDPCWEVRPDGSLWLREVSLIRNPNKGVSMKNLKIFTENIEQEALDQINNYTTLRRVSKGEEKKMKRSIAMFFVMVMLFGLVACAPATQDNGYRRINDNFTVVSNLGNASGYPAYLVYDNNTFVMYIVTIGSGVSFCPYYDSNGNVAIYNGRGY